MKKIDWLVLLFICIVSAVTLKDLFKPGLYTSHDGIHQVVRFFYFDQIIRDGQIPPRWVGGLLNGFGYPLFIFSYHLPWFIAEIIHILGSSIIDSVKMTFLVGFAASGIAMYLFQREIFGRFPAVTGTILYLFAPYRFSNIFVRGAIGDATSFIFPPLIFLSIFKLKGDTKIQWILLGGLSLAGLILSHAMVFLLFFIGLAGYIVYSYLFAEGKKRFIINVLLLLILGFGLSAYYVIPSVTERSFTKFNEIMGNAFTGSTFLNLKELLYSPWGYGMMHSREGGMSFQVGFAQLLAFFSTSVFGIFFLMKKKRKHEKTDIYKEGLFFSFLFIGSILLTLPVSLPVWKFINSLAVIDFTWRILAVVVFSASVLGGFAVCKIPHGKLFAVFLVILALYSNRNHIRINESLPWDLSFMLKLEKTTNSFDEYTPKWAKEEFIKKEKPKIEFSGKGADIKIAKNSSSNLEFSVNPAESGTIRVNTVYYPGWTAYVNGKLQNINYESTGLMEFPVARGNLTIRLKFADTPVRKISDIISLFSLLILLGGFIKYRKT